MAYKRLGDVLIDAGLITDEQLGHALKQQKVTKRRLGDELIAEDVITEAGLIEALQMQLGVEFIDLSQTDLDPEMSRVISKNVARQYNVVPVRTSPEEVYLAMSDPLNFMAIEAVKNATRKRVVPMVATQDSLMRAIMTLYGNEGAARAIEEMKRDVRATGSDDAAAGSFQTSTLGDDADAQSAPTVRLVNSIIERAATERASDIHLEPREADLHVRMRIDGVLRTILTVPKELQASVISRLKIMGGMNTSERRVPQDGRANIRLKKQDIDLRINTLPTIHGETVVIRLLDKSESLFDPSGIGLEGANLEKYQRLIGSNNGMVLIVGPTGSGKSSTMYTMIRQLNTDSVNLVTLEDPVEYNIDAVNQLHINEKTGITFASVCVPFCVRTPTSWLWARSATARRPRSPCAPPSPDTSCCPPCTRMTPHPPSTASSISAWSRTSSRAACAASSRSASCARCARIAARSTVPTPKNSTPSGCTTIRT